MASFISALALFILVLSNGCFTLPFYNESLFNSTEQNTFGLQGTFNNETNVSPTMNAQTSSTPFNTSLDNGKREFEDSFLTSTYMTEQENNGKREFEDSFLSTTDMNEQENNGKREFEDSFSTSTYMTEQENGKREFEDSFSSTTDVNEQENNGKRESQDSFPSTTDVNEQESNGKREFNDDELLATTEIPTENNHADETGQEDSKRELQVDSTTNDMLLFSSTSSSVAPQLYTSEFSTSTGKYIGHLSHENDEDGEHEHEEGSEVEPEVSTKRPVKPKKVIKKTTPEPELEPKEEVTSQEKVTSQEEVTPQEEVTSQEKVEEDSKLPTPRIAIQVPEPTFNIGSWNNYNMNLVDNETMIVTDNSTEFSKSPKSPKQIETTEMPLNQGAESTNPETEE